MTATVAALTPSIHPNYDLRQYAHLGEHHGRYLGTLAGADLALSRAMGGGVRIECPDGLGTLTGDLSAHYRRGMPAASVAALAGLPLELVHGFYDAMAQFVPFEQTRAMGPEVGPTRLALVRS
jgi:hypothetical protein